MHQVINNDRGAYMRPMPGMMGLITSTSKVICYLLLFLVGSRDESVLVMIPFKTETCILRATLLLQDKKLVFSGSEGTGKRHSPCRVFFFF